MNEIEVVVGIGPFLGDILDLEEAVWWNKLGLYWRKVVTNNLSIGEKIGDLTAVASAVTIPNRVEVRAVHSPYTSPGPKVKNGLTTSINRVYLSLVRGYKREGCLRAPKATCYPWSICTSGAPGLAGH
jgi:hypothetical protein